MYLLCPLPAGSPMTPASWGVRRMLFGYSSHSRWLSCSRRWFAEYPPPLHFTPYTLHLYTLRLHSTTYTGIPVICHVHGGCSPCLPCLTCFRVNPCSSVGGISPLPVVFCQWSGNVHASFLSLPWLSCARRWFAEYPRLYTLHFTPYTKKITKNAFFFDLVTGFVSLM